MQTFIGTYTMLKTYSNKSNARRAARKQFENDDMFTLIQDAHGKWTFIEAEVEAIVQAIEAGEKMVEVVGVAEPVVGEFTYCPHCEIHLDNGVSTFEYQQEICKQHKSQKPAIKKEFICLGCGEEFGEVVELVEPAKMNVTGKGIKIQKDREERNGIKRPSAGGKCAAVWDKCDELYEFNGMVPTPKVLKGWAEDNNHNFNNAAIELYRWRNFMGFRGR